MWADAAVYVDPDDEQGLVEIVTTLAGDEVLRRDLAARALAHAASYTPERMARGYIDVYRRLPVPVGGAR